MLLAPAMASFFSTHLLHMCVLKKAVPTKSDVLQKLISSQVNYFTHQDNKTISLQNVRYIIYCVFLGMNNLPFRLASDSMTALTLSFIRWDAYL